MGFKNGVGLILGDIFWWAQYSMQYQGRHCGQIGAEIDPFQWCFTQLHFHFDLKSLSKNQLKNEDFLKRENCEFLKSQWI